MDNKFINDISLIIKNIYTKDKKLPYWETIKQHKQWWPFVSTFWKNDIKQVKECIKIIWESILDEQKTKWWILFKQIWELDKSRFWEYRDLQEDFDIDNKKFVSLHKIYEELIWNADVMLTSKMKSRDYWVDKVTNAFYTIVYSFFPHHWCL